MIRVGLFSGRSYGAAKEQLLALHTMGRERGRTEGAEKKVILLVHLLAVCCLLPQKSEIFRINYADGTLW